MFGFAVVTSTKAKKEKAKNKDAVIIEKGKIVKYGNIDVKLLDDVPIEILYDAIVWNSNIICV